MKRHMLACTQPMEHKHHKHARFPWLCLNADENQRR